MKIFLSPPARIVKCVSEYTCLISIINKAKRQEKANETIEEKGLSVENLTGYDDIVCEFALCTFNLLDRVVNFSWLFI